MHDFGLWEEADMNCYIFKCILALFSTISAIKSKGLIILLYMPTQAYTYTVLLIMADPVEGTTLQS